MARKTIPIASEKQQEKYADFLAGGEKVVAVFGIGDKYYWLNFISLFILSIPLVGLPFLLKLVHLRHSKKYILTDRRVLVIDGVFSIKTTTAPYDKITHITVREDFFKKMGYGIGDITIHTAGPTPVEIDLVKVHNPMQVKNLIEELMVKERSLLGVVSNKEPIVKPF